MAEENLTDTQVEEKASGAVARAMAVLAVPARAYLMTVGNSVYAGWSLLAWSGVYAVTLWSVAMFGLHWNSRVAEVAYWVERAEGERLRNAKARAEQSDTGATVQTWTMASFSIDSSGARITFPVIPGAESVRVLWRAPVNPGDPGRQDTSGVWTGAIPSGAIQYDIVISPTDFGSEVWTDSDSVVTFHMEQILPDRAPVRYNGTKMALRIP